MGEKTKELYKKAKEAGKVRSTVNFLELAKREKKEDGSDGAPVSLGPKKVKLLGEKIVKGIEYKSKQERKEVEYLFELIDTGEQRKYRKPIYDENGNLHYFHEEMKNHAEGDSLVLEFKKDKGKMRGYISVESLQEQDTETEYPEEEINNNPQEELEW